MIAIIASMIIWGSIGACVLWSGLSALDAAFYRCLVGAIVLLPYCYWRGELKLNRYHLKQYGLVSCGGLFIVINWLLLFKSFQWASITLGNVSYYLQPVFLVLLGLVFFHEHISLRRWGYIALTAIGVLLTVNISPHALHLHGTQTLGVLCALGAGLLYAFATIAVKKVNDMPVSLITLIQLIVGCLVLLPWAGSHPLPTSVTTWSYIILLGVVHTALAYMLYYQGVQQISITVIAVLSYIDPIVAIFTDVAFFSRHLHAIQWLGIALTMIGSYYVIKKINLKNPIVT
ncbi:MAG: DMT family transporter [Coxiellaceae bacterium]|nr:DMT family transporter [Coxiellaceae bacterium]